MEEAALIDAMISKAKASKNGCFRGNIFDRGMPTIVEFYRRGTPVATFHTAGPNRDAGLNIVEHGAFCFAPDAVCMASDAYELRLDLDPDEKVGTLREEYESRRHALPTGELQRRWAAGNRDDITECLMATYVPRSGPATTVYVPYDVTLGKKPRLHYRTRYTNMDSVGDVIESINASLHAPNVSERLMQRAGVEALLHMDEATRFATGDVMGVEIIKRAEPRAILAILYSEKGDERRRMILDATLGPSS